MNNSTRGIPQKLLVRFGELLARCESSADDAVARQSLADLATDCLRYFPELTEAALRHLSEADVPEVRTAASQELGVLLERLDGVSRVQLVVDWTHSSTRGRRVAIARALCSQLPILGVVTALSRLANDPDSRVRRAACTASARRVENGDDAFADILRDRTRDKNRMVRLAAIEGLRETAAGKPQPERSIEALYDCVRADLGGSTVRARRALWQLGSYSRARERCRLATD